MATLPFVKQLLGWRNGNANMADKDSAASREIGAHMLKALGVTAKATDSGQTAGKKLEQAVHNHLAATLPETRGRRTVVVARGTLVSDFEQYAHLATLKALIDQDATDTLRASIGSDYLIRPDVTVGLKDQRGQQFLHAAVPCKWTLRSDRAQNIRHEGVVLIRHRRGRLPHITPVTAEPLPTRLASLARGTAEVDAVYHVALDELDAAVRAVGKPKQVQALEELVNHGRLRDLSDLAIVLDLS